MKRTGSDMPSADDSSTGDEGPAEVIERARLQADVAQQRVRLAKEELRRARKRLKEAKREARRARKLASLARKDWKRARRKAKHQGPAEKARVKKTTATRAQRAQSRSARNSKRGRGSRAGATKKRPVPRARNRR